MSEYQRDLILKNMEDNSCTGKRRHYSMRAAEEAAKVTPSDTRLIAYQCPFCQVFHVGHRKSRKRLEMERRIRRWEAKRRPAWAERLEANF